MKQIPNNVQVLLPLARPEPPPQLPADP
jgi:hypothetical protein